MKWAGAAAVALGLVALLLQLAARSDHWTSVAFDRGAQPGAIRLTLRADASVRGWTRWSLPVLVVSCAPAHGVRVAIATQLPVEVEPGLIRTVSLQFDDEPSTIAQWIVERDRETLNAPAPDVAGLASHMVRARRFTIAFVPLHAEPVIARFSLAGFGERWAHAAACTRGPA